MCLWEITVNNRIYVEKYWTKLEFFPRYLILSTLKFLRKLTTMVSKNSFLLLIGSTYTQVATVPYSRSKNIFLNQSNLPYTIRSLSCIILLIYFYLCINSLKLFLDWFYCRPYGSRGRLGRRRPGQKSKHFPFFCWHLWKARPF